jgi:hypothetical protein
MLEELNMVTKQKVEAQGDDAKNLIAYREKLAADLAAAREAYHAAAQGLHDPTDIESRHKAYLAAQRKFSQLG